MEPCENPVASDKAGQSKSNVPVLAVLTEDDGPLFDEISAEMLNEKSRNVVVERRRVSVSNCWAKPSTMINVYSSSSRTR